MSRHLPWVLTMATVCVASFFWSLAQLADDDAREVVTVTLEPRPGDRASTHARTLRAIEEPQTPEIAMLDCLARACSSSHPKSPWSMARRAPEPGFSRPAARPRTKLVALASAPFPYTGRVPRTNRPFLNVANGERRGRKTYSGRVYWADKTYNDQRVLMHIPKGFDASRPGVIVMFFHGHGATLKRDVLKRQRVPAQISESGMNAVLVAPQFAVDARDSSAGKFWRPGGVRRFLDEAAVQLAQIHGDPKSRKAFAEMPVVIVGYSGGFHPTAWALAEGGIEDRVRGVVLLDGLYGEFDKFARWIKKDNSGFFVSAHARSTTRGTATLKRMLERQNVAYSTRLAPELRPGSVTFLKADVSHRDYVTRAWARNPISDILGRMTTSTARASSPFSASLSPAFAR